MGAGQPMSDGGVFRARTDPGRLLPLCDSTSGLDPKLPVVTVGFAASDYRALQHPPRLLDGRCTLSPRLNKSRYEKP
jgi:hypothetical protein